MEDVAPNLTRFIGRERELAELERVLDGGARLVTVLGPGGVGKTRLALELCRKQASRIWFADLSSASTRDEVFDRVHAAMASVLPGLAGTRTVEELAAALQTAEVPLLVVDNVDSVLADAAPLLTALLHAVPALTVLATSRCALGLRGEIHVHLDALPTADAIALFVERARARRPSWSPSADEQALITALVERLDALPLALELASAWMDVLSVRELLERLDRQGHRFELLRSDERDRASRHVSLEAVLESSWQLLEPPVQDVLAGCSVFRGGFELRAAEHLLDGAVVDGLRTLRAMGFLRARHAGEHPVRYALYESVRELASGKLAAERRAELAMRHAAYFASVAHSLEGDALRAQAEARRWFAENTENLSAAASASVTHDPARAVVLCRVLVATAPGSCEAYLGLLDALCEHAAPETLARALTVRAAIHARAARMDDVARDGARARQLATEHELPDVAIEASRWLAIECWSRARWPEAVALYERVLELARAAGDDDGEIAALRSIAMVRWPMGQLDAAFEQLERALALSRRAGLVSREAHCLVSVAGLCLVTGDLASAVVHAEQARERSREVGAWGSELEAVSYLGVAALVRGAPEDAIRELEPEVQRAEQLGFRVAQADLSMLIAAAHLTLGRPRQASELLRPTLAATGLPWRGWYLIWAVAAAAEGDDLAQARRWLAEMEPSSTPPSPAPFPALPHLAEQFLRVAEARARHASDAQAARALLDEVQAVIDGVLAASRTSGRTPAPALSITHALQASVARAGSRFGSPPTGDGAPALVLQVGASATWFIPPVGERVDLTRRGALRRLLWRLVEARRAAPGTPLSNDELQAAGWPGQQLLHDSGAMRVYVAIGSLRRLGLRAVLLTHDGGYVLDPSVRVDLAP